MKAQLSWSEALIAASFGVGRRVQALRLGREHRYNFGASPWECWNMDVNSALGSMCGSKALDRYWDCSILTDVSEVKGEGKTIVRTTEQPSGHLLLHKDDPDS